MIYRIPFDYLEASCSRGRYVYDGSYSSGSRSLSIKVSFSNSMTKSYSHSKFYY